MSSRPARRIALGVALALGLSTPLLPSAGAAVVDETHLVAADRSSARDDQIRPWGRSSSPDGRLRAGCASYRMNYDITPPSDEWSGLILVIAPSGKRVASMFIDSGAPDPRKGTKRYRLCRQSVVPGQYKTYIRLIVDIDDRTTRRGMTRPTTFRFRA